MVGTSTLLDTESRPNRDRTTRLPLSLPFGQEPGISESPGPGGGGPARGGRARRARQIGTRIHGLTPAGMPSVVGPLERGFSEITNATDFKGWAPGSTVVGFYGEQSKALRLAGVANMIQP
jgi:hypothetical protein